MKSSGQDLTPSLEIEIEDDWWKTIFDELYLITDARSVLSDKLTAREVDNIIDFTGASKDWDILDLCGGHGRHSRGLVERGFRSTIVYDYSDYLLCRGRDDCQGKVRFLRGDAREIGLRDASFELVMILGNSFGYFIDNNENRKVLREAHRVLRPGGILLLDIIDRDYIMKNFRPESVHEPDGKKGITVSRTRDFSGDIIKSREVVADKDGTFIRENRYQERIFDLKELTYLAIDSGFSLIPRRGTLLMIMQRSKGEGLQNTQDAPQNPKRNNQLSPDLIKENDFGFMEGRVMIKLFRD